MKIAIIGGGISGLVTAYLLSNDHEIVLFEANDRLGGHTNTVSVNWNGKTYDVDTGFIVFNNVNYPNFTALLKKLSVPSQPAPMSFSVKCKQTGLEYNPHSPRSLFAQRRNLLSPSFYRMILDILRFRRSFDSILESVKDDTLLGDYLEDGRYSKLFVKKFLIPLGSAIWSTDPSRFGEFPLRSFVQFFKNHGFLLMRNPISWRTVKGGSNRYVEKMAAPFAGRVRLKCPVTFISRKSDGVIVKLADGKEEWFEQVILAVHSDEALAMLSDPTDQERDILRAIPYQRNETILHTDSSLLPHRQRVWASWNALIPAEEASGATLTYNMNILQTLSAPVEFCVTLNHKESIDPAKQIECLTYYHPFYSVKAFQAQKRRDEISGVNRTHYAGAYWGYGFHEDGVNSALHVCRYFGKSLIS